MREEDEGIRTRRDGDDDREGVCGVDGEEGALRKACVSDGSDGEKDSERRRGEE